MCVVVSNITCPRSADILLVLDQSTSIVIGDPLYENWYVRVLGFAKGIAGAFSISANRTQVGLLKFSSGSEVVFHLDRYGDRRSLLNAIDGVDIHGGQTNIAAALRVARSMFVRSHGARGGVPKLVVMLTDGEANREAGNTMHEAGLTKAAGIVVYAVGVTDVVDRDQLRKIASKPEYFFFAPDFAQLSSVLGDLVGNLCKEAATLTTTTTTTTMSTTTTTAAAATPPAATISRPTTPRTHHRPASTLPNTAHALHARYGVLFLLSLFALGSVI